MILDWTLDLLATSLKNLDYTSQWHSPQFSVTVYIPLSLFLTVGLQFTVALGPLSLLSFTISLVSASNCRCSLSWVPELSLSHGHSNSLLTAHSLNPSS